MNSTVLMYDDDRTPYQELYQQYSKHPDEVTEGSLRRCLRYNYFCYLDCQQDFNMYCNGKEMAFAIFIPYQQHMDHCVIPRAKRMKPKTPIERKKCKNAPCDCHDFQDYFKYAALRYAAKRQAYQ